MFHAAPPHKFRSNRGATLISTLVAINLLVAGLAVYSLYFNSQARLMSLKHEKVQATAFAAELLEYFRSLNGAQLKTYLSTNPITGLPNPAGLYPLCSHINALDRVHSTNINKIILNADPIADLPATLSGSARLTGCSLNSEGNRYFQVQVVDATNNFAMVPAACGTSPATYNLAPNQRYMVTVSVTWIPCRPAITEPEHIALSTVLPQ